VPPLRTALGALRNKRYFDLMDRLASAALAAGQRDAQVRRQYAQGLIDGGKIGPAIALLHDLATDTSSSGATPSAKEHAEARGLLGRAFKQAYVNAANRPSLIDVSGATPAAADEYRCRAACYRDYLDRAIDYYRAVFDEDPERNLWHGINTVACVRRAQRDGFASSAYPDATAIAQQILGQLESIEPRTRVDVWDRATAIEACVALDRLPDALEWLALYTNDENADAFEFGSTLRQLIEVWQLTPGSDPGRQILPPLHAALLKREGGSVELSARPQSAFSVEQELGGLEAVYDGGRFLTLQWYKTGLQRCDAVGRIETAFEKGVGSGFLVRGEDIDATFAGRFLFMTNAHVVSDDPAVQQGRPAALAPHKARVRFEARQAAGAKTYAVKQLLWTSPPGNLDATLLELDETVTCDPPCPLALSLPVPDQDRVYVIGHPKGGGLSFSFDNNVVVAAKEPKLHYRAPTEPGSSGSPVFNDDWELVAIHHFGNAAVASAKGTVFANEGIWMSAIVKAIVQKLT
jgi:V8-like Glu-specific endopeptidase